jgi:hypothetical protein
VESKARWRQLERAHIPRAACESMEGPETLTLTIKPPGPAPHLEAGLRRAHARQVLGVRVKRHEVVAAHKARQVREVVRRIEPEPEAPDRRRPAQLGVLADARNVGEVGRTEDGVVVREQRGALRRSTVNGQWSTVNGQRSTVNGQWSTASLNANSAGPCGVCEILQILQMLHARGHASASLPGVCVGGRVCVCCTYTTVDSFEGSK